MEKTVSLSLLGKAVLLEGIYYVFNIVFIIYLFVRGTTLTSYGAATSYLAQVLLVTPAFLALYFGLKSKSYDSREVAKWGALAIIGFIFAL